MCIRDRNAAYLTAKLKDLPGMVPQKLYPGTESGSFYLYPMTYRKEHFNGVSRATFLKALRAEGIGLSPYITRGLHKEPWVENVLKTKLYTTMFSQERLQKYRDENRCPTCDQVCEEMAMIWASGPLLGAQDDMDDIINALYKVYENRAQLPAIEES